MGGPSADYLRDMELSLLDALRGALRSEGLDTVAKQIQIGGFRDPAEDKEEWISFFVLATTPNRRPRNFFQGTVLFQVGCASRLGERRKDKNTHRPQQLASIVRGVFDSVDLPIYAFDATGTRGARRGVLSVHEGADRYMSQRQGSASGMPGSLGVGVPLDSHAVMLTYRGVTDTQRT